MQKRLILLIGCMSLMISTGWSNGNDDKISSHNFIESDMNLNKVHNAILSILGQKSQPWQRLKPNLDKLLSYMNYKNNDIAMSQCAVKVWGHIVYTRSADVWKTYLSDEALGKEIMRIQGYNMVRQIRNNADTTWKYLEDMIPEIQ